MDYNACTEKKKSSKIVVSENKSKFIIINNKKKVIHKVKVDGCLISENSKKCDWLFEINPKSKELVIFLELKGVDLKHAIRQIESTIQQTKSRFDSYLKKESIVSCRSVPKMRGGLQVQKAKHLKNYKSKLTIFSNSNGKIII